MVFVVLGIDGTQGVHLVPENVYRIGRRLGVEFYKDDESIELVHAWIGVIADGAVRISAVAGKTYVGEKEIEAKSITESDAVDGLVILRFGNVRAQLRFKRNLDAEGVLDSSGYDEEVKNKTADTTADSSFIPETRPPSTNTTRDGESFMLPETQAVSFNRPSMPNEKSRISLNDDFLIPETQDVLLKNPFAQRQNNDTVCKDDEPDIETETQMVSFIRPSESNKQSNRSLDEDIVVPETQDVLFNSPVAQHENTDIPCRDDESELGTQIRICTQDFYNSDEDAIDDFNSSILLEDGRQAGNHTANHPKDKVGTELEMSVLNWCANNSNCTAINSTAKNGCLTPEDKLSAQDDVPCTPDFLDAFQTLETPDPTPAKTGDNSEDFIKTQVFPVMNQSNRSFNTQDFIATQKFETAKHLQNSNVDTSNEDFIETQIFPPQRLLLEPSLSKEPEHNTQDFIETQAFTKEHLTCESTAQDPHHTVLNVSALIHTTTEDMIETQVFVRPTDNTITRTDKLGDMRLNLSDSISIGDKLDTELKKLMDISSLPSSPSDVEEYNRNVAIINENKKRLAINTLNSIKNSAQISSETTASFSKAKKKSATRPVSEEALPKKRIKVETKSPVVVLRTLRKRSLVQNTDSAGASIMKTSKTPKIDLNSKVAKHDSTDFGPKEDRSSSTSLQPFQCKDLKVSLTKSSGTKVLATKREKEAENEKNGFIENKDEHLPPNQSKTSKEFKIKDTKTKKQNDLGIKAVTTSERKLTKNHKKEEVKDIDRLVVGESDSTCSMELINDDGCESKLSENQLLKDINAYIKKIKKSGRKIQLTFSRCNLAELRSTLFSLKSAMEVIENPQFCDVLIMDKGERTYKFLVGVALNKPILSTRWLLSVKETHSIDIKPEHIFSDDKFEQSYKFKPLLVMNKPKLLKGIGFMLGSTIQPSAKDMKAIIEGAGGSVHSKAPSITCKSPLYVVLQQQDQHLEKQIRNINNVQYIKTEAVMQALVQHRTELLNELKFQLSRKHSQ